MIPDKSCDCPAIVQRIMEHVIHARSMCGTREFCRGCEHAKGGHCSDSIAMGLIPSASINYAMRREAHEF